MDRSDSHRWLAASLALLTLLALAGCGAAGAGGGGTTSGVGGHSTATLPCNGTPVTPSVTPSVTLRNSDSGHTASAAVGAVVEIRLDGAHVWRLGSVQPANALAPIGEQGALEQGECVWDFTVNQPGDVTITFAGTALCPPNAMCPQYALLAKFTIHAS